MYFKGVGWKEVHNTVDGILASIPVALGLILNSSKTFFGIS